jgi:hypothetical protein
MATTIQPKDIAILRRQMRETKNETLKNALKKKIERLTEDLKAQETPAKDLAMALFKAKDEINAMAKSEFNAIVKRLANKPGYSFLKTMSKSEIKDDLKREAKPVGWRFRGRTNFKKPTAKDVKTKNDVYYEARRDRSDVIRPAKLAKGGGVKSKKSEQYVITDLEFDELTNIVYDKKNGYPVENKKLAKQMLTKNNGKRYAEGDGGDRSEGKFWVLDEKTKFGYAVKVNQKDRGLTTISYHKTKKEAQQKVDSLNKSKYAEGGSIGDVKYKVGDYIAKGITNRDGYADPDFKRPLVIGKIENGKVYLEGTDGKIRYSEPVKFFEKELKDGQYLIKNRSFIERTFKKYAKPKQYDEGGSVGDENKGMVMNNNVQIMHHAKELSQAVKSADHIPAWVVAKVYDATQTLSDVTHYLDGENKMETGGLLKDKATYIPNRMISTLEVERNGKTIDIDPADIVDGVYVKKRVKYGEGGGVKQFDFVYEKWGKPVSGTIGTIRTKPENYWVATIKEGDIIVFDSWDGAVKDIDKSSVSKMWQSGQIPTK